MSKPISFGELDFNLVAAMEERHAVPESERPFRMLFMGDFSGKSSRGQNKSALALSGLKPIQVDRDTIEEVLDRLEVELELPLLGENAPPISIRISELDDFHPDSLYYQLEVFQALRDTRKSLYDFAAFDAFAAKVQSGGKVEKEIDFPEVAGVEKTTGNLLDQIIEQSQPEPQKSTSGEARTEWDSFLQDIVRPHLVARPHPKQEEMIDAVDEAASELMRMILHHKDFQALEAAWKGLSFLVSRLETDRLLHVFLFDVTKSEIAADLFSTDDLRGTSLYKLLVEQTVGMVGGLPWAVVAGNYTFEKENQDMELLGRMAKIVKAAGVPFVAAAGDRFLCQHSLAKTPDPDEWKPDENQEMEKRWQALRHIPEAAHLGLILPRILLRLPYGASTEPLSTFNFEEMPEAPVHANYLWGNPCLAVMVLLGQTFSMQGWQMRPGSILEIDYLPLHVYKEDGESRLKPCAEAMLSERAAERIMDKGLMPLLSFLNQDTVRLGRFQSIAEPAAQLNGPWS
ncbi:MAG: type VI secretion system contractile sheath large subunit [Desulfobulbaceae bacterium]|nr:type VI secretion system contractile sheath large subunit [Desulfobulbaceae bacterium]